MKNSLLIKNSDISVRAINALEQSGYLSWTDCQNLTLLDLYRIENIGKKTAHEIIDCVKRFSSDPRLKKHNYTSKKAPGHVEREKYFLKVLSISIPDVNLSVRAANALKDTGAETMLDLIERQPREILKLKACGMKTLSEITRFLEKLDLQFEMDIDPFLSKKIKARQKNMNREDILNEFELAYPGKFTIFMAGKLSDIPDSKIKFYLDCFQKYKKVGSLQSVAEIMGLTRERIRQILVKGTKLGLFKYSGYEYPFVEKIKILEDYSKALSLVKVAKANKISLLYLRKLLTAYKVTEEDLRAIRANVRKKECIESFKLIESEIGHPPTATELYNSRSRYLLIKIAKIWGSIGAFREDLKIPQPVRIFPEATRKWLENRKRIGLIVRMQNLDQIRECLEKLGPLRTTEIALECNIKAQNAFRLIQLLLARGEVIRQGVGYSTKSAIKVGEADQ